MKTIMKSILSVFALTMFVASTSFAQDADINQDAQTSDTYTQDEHMTQDQQDYTTQDGMENQDTQGQLGQTTPEQGDENRTQIAQEELPSEVSNSLEEGKYADFTVAEAYEIDDQGEKTYEVHFETPDGQTEQATFNESGEIAR